MARPRYSPRDTAPAARTRPSRRWYRHTAQSFSPGPRRARGMPASALHGPRPGGRHPARDMKQGHSTTSRPPAVGPRSPGRAAREFPQGHGTPARWRPAARAPACARDCPAWQWRLPDLTICITSRSTPGESGPRSTRSPRNAARRNGGAELGCRQSRRWNRQRDVVGLDLLRLLP